jgi:hypothetical protein
MVSQGIFIDHQCQAMGHFELGRVIIWFFDFKPEPKLTLLTAMTIYDATSGLSHYSVKAGLSVIIFVRSREATHTLHVRAVRRFCTCCVIVVRLFVKLQFSNVIRCDFTHD